MGIWDLFRKKRTIQKKPAAPICSASRDEEIRRLQLSLQSPYIEEREKALDNLRTLSIQCSRPVTPTEESSLRIERMVLVLDRSESMGSTDYAPSRLTAATDAAREMVNIRAERDPRDEMGVVWFNEKAEILARLVCLRDGKGHLMKVLRKLTPDDGTDIEAGLRRARELLHRKRSGVQDRIVLLTDGHSEWPILTANVLKAEGVVIDVIGIGGSPAEVNEELLRQVASTIDGEVRYRFITNRAELLEHFRRLADKLVK